jgi:hypothetical protein
LDIKQKVELLQNGAESKALRNLPNESRFLEFDRDESSWVYGAKSAKLFIESEILRSASSGKVIVLDSLVLGNQASISVLECVVK